MALEDTIVTLKSLDTGVEQDIAVKDIVNEELRAEFMMILNSPRVIIGGKLVRRI